MNDDNIPATSHNIDAEALQDRIWERHWDQRPVQLSPYYVLIDLVSRRALRKKSGYQRMVRGDCLI